MIYNNLINLKKLMNLFSAFVIGSLSFIILLLSRGSDFFPLNGGLEISLFLIFAISYELVFLFVLFYYIAEAKTKISEHFDKNREKYLIGVILVLAITSLIITTKTFGGFITNLITIVLVLITIPQINKRFIKWWNKIGKKE